MSGANRLASRQNCPHAIALDASQHSGKAGTLMHGISTRHRSIVERLDDLIARRFRVRLDRRLLAPLDVVRADVRQRLLRRFLKARNSTQDKSSRNKFSHSPTTETVPESRRTMQISRRK
jgi:hypothetical protein